MCTKFYTMGQFGTCLQVKQSWLYILDSTMFLRENRSQLNNSPSCQCNSALSRLSHPIVSSAAVRSTVVAVLWLLIHCLLFLGSVFDPCLVMHCAVSFLVLQSSR